MAQRPDRMLLTGFEPFGGDAVNPSWEIARALDGERIAGVRVVAVQLPCVFGQAHQVLAAALRQHRPQLVLCLGLAANRAALSVERVGINMDDARIPDNAGAQPLDQPAVPGAPAAYFATLPIKAMVAALQAAGLPAEVSQTAGTFVCNHVLFGLMHQLRRRRGVRGGFMHVPWLPEQAALAGVPRLGGLALEDQVRGVRVALQTAWCVQADLAHPGGAVS
jgi:pyroglutamyl-peptidase